jgi:hypothetical protein
MPSRVRSIVVGCGCEFVNVGDLRGFHRNEKMILRFFYWHDFLLLNHQRFKRVILADVADVVFQCDPFRRLFPVDSIHITEENVNGSEWQYKTATIVVGTSEATRIIRGYPTLNIGLMTGTRETILPLLSAFRAYFRDLLDDKIDDLITNYIPDQVVMNLLIRMNNISFTPYKSGEMLTSLWRLFNRPEMEWVLGKWRHSNKSDYPCGIHLYDRSESFAKSVFSQCQPAIERSDVRFDNVRFD